MSSPATSSSACFSPHDAHHLRRSARPAAARPSDWARRCTATTESFSSPGKFAQRDYMAGLARRTTVAGSQSVRPRQVAALSRASRARKSGSFLAPAGCGGGIPAAAHGVGVGIRGLRGSADVWQAVGRGRVFEITEHATTPLVQAADEFRTQGASHLPSLRGPNLV